MKFLSWKKVGGLYHWRIGRLGGSFYWKRAPTKYEELWMIALREEADAHYAQEDALMTAALLDYDDYYEWDEIHHKH